MPSTVLVLNALAVVFGAGGAFYALWQMRREVRLLWQKFDVLNEREQRHFQSVLVALTALASATNPHPRKDILDLIKKMTDQD